MFLPDFRVWNALKENELQELNSLISLSSQTSSTKLIKCLEENTFVINKAELFQWMLYIYTSSLTTGTTAIAIQNIAFPSIVYKLNSQCSSNCNFVNFNTNDFFQNDDDNIKNDTMITLKQNKVMYMQKYNCLDLETELQTKPAILRWNNCFKEIHIQSPAEENSHRICVCHIQYSGVYTYGLGEFTNRSASDVKLRCLCSKNRSIHCVDHQHSLNILNPKTTMHLRYQYQNNAQLALLLFEDCNEKFSIISIL